MYAFSGEEMHSFYQTPQGAVWPPKGKEPLLQMRPHSALCT